VSAGLEPPKLRDSPARNPAVRIRSFGDDAQQPLRFYLFQDVLDELTYSARYDDRTFLAVLVGGFGVEQRGAFIELTGFTGASWFDDFETAYPAVKEACDDWIRNHEEDAALAGFFVSVPGCRGRVGTEMLRVHLSLFNVPFQPLVVFDPRSGKLTVNARASGAPLGNAAFCVVAEHDGWNPSDKPVTPDTFQEE
jgi:hypothetical protein